MKTRRACRVLAVVVSAAFLCSWLAAGCETRSASDTLVSISPTVAQLASGRSQVFTASGADDYQWALSSEAYGFLSNRTGPSTTFTCTYQGGGSGTVSVALNVQGNIGGSTGSVSNESPWRATATIICGPETFSDLRVDPGSGTSLLDGGYQTYTASGGTGQYSWSVTESGAGTGFLSSTSGSKVSYVSDYSGATAKTVLLTCTSGTDTYTVSIELK